MLARAMAGKRTLEDGPLDDPSKATGRLRNMRIPFVSAVDVPANLVPFLVMKGQAMSDENLTLNAETREALRGLFGSVVQMAGDLMATVDGAADSTEAPPGVPAEIQSGIAALLGMLEPAAGSPAPDAGPATPEPVVQNAAPKAPVTMQADAKAAAKSALESACAALNDACAALDAEDDGAEMAKKLGIAKAALKALATKIWLMNLATCDACGRDVSVESATCPGCGHPRRVADSPIRRSSAATAAPAVAAAPLAPAAAEAAPVAKAGRVLSAISEAAITNAIEALQGVLSRSRKSCDDKVAKSAESGQVAVAKALADKDAEIAALKARAEAAETELVAVRKARQLPQSAPIGAAPSAPTGASQSNLTLQDKIHQARSASVSRVR